MKAILANVAALPKMARIPTKNERRMRITTLLGQVRFRGSSSNKNLHIQRTTTNLTNRL